MEWCSGPALTKEQWREQHRHDELHDKDDRRDAGRRSVLECRHLGEDCDPHRKDNQREPEDKALPSAGCRRVRKELGRERTPCVCESGAEGDEDSRSKADPVKSVWQQRRGRQRNQHDGQHVR